MFAKATGGDPSQLGRKDVDEFRAALAPLAEAGQAGRAARAVSRQLQERARVARLPGMAAEVLPGLSGRRRAPASQLERAAERDRSAAGGIRGGAGADRRAEVQDVDPPEPAAQREELLLPAAARPQRRAVVEARRVRGSLQLPVHARGAASRSRKRRRRPSARSRRRTSTPTTTSPPSRWPTPRF